jgi:hypothetical protein
MSELERYDPADPATTPPAAGMPAADFREWLPALEAAASIAREIASTEFVPSSLRDNPAAVSAAILAGRELRIGPMAALQHVHVVEGRPALSAEMARALILAHGHQLRWREITAQRCVLSGRRRGEHEWTTVTWSMEDARRARINGRQNWQKHPRRMLQARCSGELARLQFADCLAGMSAQLVEEASDDADDTGPAEAAPSRKVRRTTPVRAQAERASGEANASEDASESEQPAGPPLPGEQGEASASEGASADPEDAKPPDMPPMDEWHEPASDAQLRYIHALFSSADLDDREKRLRVARSIGRRPELTSSRELTKREAGVLIDTVATVVRNASTSADAGESLITLAYEAEQEEAEDHEEDSNEASASAGATADDDESG